MRHSWVNEWWWKCNQRVFSYVNKSPSPKLSLIDNIEQNHNNVDATSFLKREMYAEVDREIFHRNQMNSEFAVNELEELNEYESLQNILATHAEKGIDRVKKYYKLYQ